MAVQHFSQYLPLCSREAQTDLEQMEDEQMMTELFFQVNYPLKYLKQGCPLVLQKGQCPAEFSSKTLVQEFLINLKSLIVCLTRELCRSDALFGAGLDALGLQVSNTLKFQFSVGSLLFYYNNRPNLEQQIHCFYSIICNMAFLDNSSTFRSSAS